MKRKKIITSILILVILGVALMLLSCKCLKCSKFHVVHNYFSSIGLDGAFPTYANVVATIGEPNEESLIENNGAKMRVLNYIKFALFFSTSSASDNSSSYFNHLEIYSPDIRLTKQVHVGSSRAQIIWAYKSATPDKTKALGCAYGDYRIIDWLFDNLGEANTRYVEFIYDENDLVTEIHYYPIWG